MRSEEEVIKEMINVKKEYSKLRSGGELTNTKRLKLESRIKCLEWILELQRELK